MVGLSVGEKHFIQGGIAQDLRSDGRKRLTYRPIYVETGVIPQVSDVLRNSLNCKKKKTAYLFSFLWNEFSLKGIMTGTWFGKS